MTLNPVWHRMLYSYTHMATTCVKGLNEQLLIGPIINGVTWYVCN